MISNDIHPIDLIYFNHKTMRYPKFAEAEPGHGGVEAALLAWPQPAVIIIMWAVGRWGEFAVIAWRNYYNRCFGSEPRLPNAGIIVIMILSGSVRTSEMVVAVGAEGVRGQWLVVV